MLSEQAVCNIIKAKNNYKKENNVYYYLRESIDIGESFTVNTQTMITLNKKTNNVYVYTTLNSGNFTLNISGKRNGKADPKDSNYRMKLTKIARNSNDRRRQKMLDTYFPLKEFNEIEKEDI